MKRCSTPLSSGKFKLEPGRGVATYLLGWLDLKRPVTPGAGEDVERLEHPQAPDGNANGHRHFGKRRPAA